MKKFVAGNFSKWKQLGLVMLGAYVVSGCPSPTVSNLIGAQGANSQEGISQVGGAAIAQETTSAADTASDNAVAFEICAAVETWQRPSDAEQSKQLSADPRYGEALNDSPLKAASNQFWSHEAVSFTTYGLSARMEPEMLAGLWTVSDKLAGCYGAESTMAINEGDRAETWLLNKQITSLGWEDDRYIMTVESAPTGMQIVQFDRVDQLASLPLEIVTENGTSVDVISGDWQ
ncbi:MAG: hypothetical protein AAF171_13480 [Cyanobacteria bacterium P01_A01_bin.116]